MTEQRGSAREREADQQQATVGSRRVSAHVREVKILRDQKPVRLLSGLPHGVVIMSGETFEDDCIDVVAEIRERLDESAR